MLSILKSFYTKLYQLAVNKKSFSAIKGYRLLKKGNTDFVNQIRVEIANSQIKIKPSLVENLIFPQQINLTLSVHQYLLKLLLGRMFTRSVLSCVYTKKKLIYPLPIGWSKIVNNSGLKVSYFWNTILFYVFISIFWFYGVYFVFKSILINKNRRKYNESYAYFFNLNQECFPSLRKSDSYTIISWYCKKFKNQSKHIVHSVPSISDYNLDEYKISYSIDHIPKISNFNFFFKVIPKLIFMFTLMTLFNIVFLRWWNILLLKEIVEMYIFHNSDSKNVADEYFFHFSHQIYRPLWTYVAESRGSDLIFYYYSSPISTFKNENGKYTTVPEFLQVMNWPKYLVWNQTHSNYLQSQIKYPGTINIVGPIWFQESCVELPKITKPAIVVFDITPYREFFSHTFANAQEYTYHHKVPINFLSDLQEITSELGIHLYFKRKMNKGYNLNMLNKKYLNFLSNFIKKDNVTEINSGVSPDRVCQEFDLVFSMPFTSTAVVAHSYKKHSVYYDPIGVIQKDDRAGHNLTVLNKKVELKTYLKLFYNIK